MIRGETLNLNNLLFHPYHTLSGKDDHSNIEQLSSQPVTQTQIQQLPNNTSNNNNTSNTNSNTSGNTGFDSKLKPSSTSTGTNNTPQYNSQNHYNNNPELEIPNFEISPLLTKNAILNNPIAKKVTIESTYGSVY